MKDIEHLGSGSFGEVKLVSCDEYPGLSLACKFLTNGKTFDSSKELSATLALMEGQSHPNVIQTHALVEDQGSCVGLLMEYAAGGNLTDVIFPGNKPMPVEDAANPISFEQRLMWSVQIASALTKLHRSKLWHRDLKPDNVLLTSSTASEADVKLSDLGQSKLASSSATQSTKTMTTTIYYAPEGFRGVWGPASDVFQLGLTLYQVLTGRLIWESHRESDTFPHCILHLLFSGDELPEKVGSWPGLVPEAVRDIVKRCLEADRSLRPTALDVARVLAQARVRLLREKGSN